MKKKALVMVMAAAMAAAMTACGGSKSATADTTAAAADTAAESKAESKADETTAAADTSDKTWVIATDTAFKPFEYTDDSGNFVGIDMEILKAMRIRALSTMYRYLAGTHPSQHARLVRQMV